VHDRHVLLGESGSDDDFLFDCFSKDFCGAEIATVRFDSRGVFGNKRDECILSIRDPVERERKFYELCIDQSIRASVTPKTQLNDVFSVYNYCVTRFNGAIIILVGHSEGCINISRMISEYELRKVRALYLSPSMVSPRDLIEWQRVRRFTQWIRELKPNGGDIHVDDVRREFGFSKLSSICTIESALPHGGVWTSESLEKRFQSKKADFDREVAWISGRDDASPWPGPVTIASFSWWKQWHTDTTPVIEHLKSVEGIISCVFGEFDTQIDYDEQIACINSYREMLKVDIFVDVIKDVGHSFGYHGVSGPPEHFSRRIITEKLIELLV